jgi:dihydropteroate synthase
MFENIKFPKIIGVLNVTPDSFSDAGRFFSKNIAVEHGLKMLDMGADIIDIGGQSTRPGAENVDIDEELKRVIPVISLLKKNRPNAILSIDTMKYDVANEAIKQGAKMINDVSGLNNDTRLAELAAQNNIPLILMHMQGTPRTMQSDPVYKNVVKDIFSSLENKIAKAKAIGVKSIIVDAGIGFGKTTEHNLTLLKNYEKFKELDADLMIGISRKSFIGNTLDIQKPADRDFATIIYHSLLLDKKIDYIRIHNLDMGILLKKIFFSLKN